MNGASRSAAFGEMRYIGLCHRDGVATITLRHPRGNRINFGMRAELLSAVCAVEASDARVLVVRGEGDDFCLGGDVREWAGVSAAELRPLIGVFATALDQLSLLNIPTIAAVQGTCAGGGFELALSCDMIVACRSAVFSFPEAQLGLMTLQGGVLQLAERVGRSKAVELAFLAEATQAVQMADWNVVNRIVKDEEFDDQIVLLAGRLASGPPCAYAATKSFLRTAYLEGAEKAKSTLYDISMPLFDTEDVQAALASMVGSISTGRPYLPTRFAGR